MLADGQAAHPSAGLTGDAALAARLQHEEFLQIARLRASLNRFNRNGAANDGSVNSEAPLLVGNDNQEQRAPAQPAQGSENNLHRNIQLIQGIEEARSRSPRLLLCQIIIGLIELITTSCIVAVNWDEACSATGGLNLKWWLLVFSLRHVIQWPIAVWRYKLSLRRETPAIASRLRKIKKVWQWLSIASFVWWIFGQFLLYDPQSQASECPSLYIFSIIVIVGVYLAISLPLLLLLGFCICFPCVVLVYRYLTNQSADGTTIESNTTTFKYSGPESIRGTIQRNYPNALNAEQDGPAPEDEPEDPKCSICMCEFDQDDEMRLLPCGHVFHKDCVDVWLGQHKKLCPLCRHDITVPLEARTGLDAV